VDLFEKLPIEQEMSPPDLWDVYQMIASNTFSEVFAEQFGSGGGFLLPFRANAGNSVKLSLR